MSRSKTTWLRCPGAGGKRCPGKRRVPPTLRPGGKRKRCKVCSVEARRLVKLASWRKHWQRYKAQRLREAAKKPAGPMRRMLISMAKDAGLVDTTSREATL
jgi:hypothetical protein